MLASLQQEAGPLRIVEAYEGLGRTYQQFDNTAEALRYYLLGGFVLGWVTGKLAPGG